MFLKLDNYTTTPALNRDAPDEIKAQSMVETLRQIREVMDDKELTDFLSSFLPQSEKTPSSPSSNVGG